MAKIKKMGSIYYKDATAKPGFTCYDSEPRIFIKTERGYPHLF